MAEMLARQIVAASGYANPNQHHEMLDYYRGSMQSFESQAESCIALVFQQKTFEEMEDWTLEKLMKYLARAEWVMQNIWKIPIEFKEPEEEQEEETAPPSMQEIAEKIREQGGDPMFALAEQIRTKPDYMEYPMIGGTKLFDNEEVLEYVRQQVQRLSNE